MGNTIGKLFILFLAMLFMLSMYNGRKSSNTIRTVVQEPASLSHKVSSHQQWKSVADYADRLTAKANNAEQYFR